MFVPQKLPTEEEIILKSSHITCLATKYSETRIFCPYFVDSSVTEIDEFIFYVAIKFLLDVATHQHGCYVLQRCIDFSKGKSLEREQRLVIL
ncbi:hypothetical protein P8452_11384 [Trifolium repens]|nr:hypothetical protein P8452_11384 [Trifolium repens]